MEEGETHVEERGKRAVRAAPRPGTRGPPLKPEGGNASARTRPSDDVLSGFVLILLGIGVFSLPSQRAGGFAVFAIFALAICMVGGAFLTRAITSGLRLDPTKWRRPGYAQARAKQAHALAVMNRCGLLLGGCAIYFTFFWQLWGEVNRVKVLVAAALVVATALTLRIWEVPPPVRRSALGTGRHRRRRSRWSLPRVIVGMMTGALWCVIGGWHGLGLSDASMDRFPLLIGLCWIVSSAIGCSIFAIAYTAPRNRVRKRHG